MNVSWLLIVAVLVAMVQSMIFRRFGLRRVEYERFFNVAECFAGDEVEMVERIANRKLLPVPWLRLEAIIHTGLQFGEQGNLEVNSGEYYQNHKSLFSLLPYTQIVRRHRVRCLKRGSYRLQSAAMTSGDMLGFQAGSRSLQLDARLLVFPRPAPLAEIPLPSHSWLGDFTVRRWIVDDPFLIAGVREYRYGDPLNGINWKATARSGRLQVHNRDFTADHRLMILVNMEISETMWDAVTDPELVEKGITYAATLARYAVAQGMDTGFGCNGQTAENPKVPVRVAPGSGQAHLHALYETMAKLEIEVSLPFDLILAADADAAVTGTDYLLITPFVSAKIRQQMDRLADAGNAVEVVWLRHEGAEGAEKPTAGQDGVSPHGAKEAWTDAG